VSGASAVRSSSGSEPDGTTSPPAEPVAITGFGSASYRAAGDRGPESSAVREDPARVISHWAARLSPGPNAFLQELFKSPNEPRPRKNDYSAIHIRKNEVACFAESDPAGGRCSDGEVEVSPCSRRVAGRWHRGGAVGGQASRVAWPGNRRAAGQASRISGRAICIASHVSRIASPLGVASRPSRFASYPSSVADRPYHIKSPPSPFASQAGRLTGQAGRAAAAAGRGPGVRAVRER
jgi:hypothetical protein